HFADQNDVRVFTQRSAKGSGKRLGVQSHFAVVHKALLAGVNEFDRIFNRDDVILTRFIGVVHDGGESGRLSASRRTRNENESFLQSRKLAHDRRQTQLVAGQDFRGDLAKHGADTVLLVEEVGAIASDTRNLVAKIDIAGFF